ncbi:MFS general substrate transporter [Basidiobolus meristosporus CBS 931.73]|uniref:MFS general substrate transporter n=1 Tax=Basidiobolus meristosporus CBS 931.73 TaxID=1314790 RepID=A0A1Y1ZB37_9FUNG|nr:MFS general substrate transporter [Basidiobolus meristosporus CBS 931.73]|eukprot:ORY07314.1 MFS general substrate transporter [Basidiobolus meristosporus CBS 931.73]
MAEKGKAGNLAEFDHSQVDQSKKVEGYIPDLEWSIEEEKRLVRLLDTRIFPWVLLTTFILNIDRTNLSNALTNNMPHDLGMSINEINTGTLLFSIVFTIFAFPSNVAVKKWHATYWISFLMFSWGVVTWCHALIHDISGFLSVRVFLAATEAGFIPACLYYLSLYYKTHELGSRLAWFWGFQSLASAISSIMSFGILQMAGIGGLEGWKWLFLIDGLLTNVVAVLTALYLPISPFKTKGLLRGRKPWFTEREAQILVTRLIRDDPVKIEQSKPVSLQDIRETFTDVRLWIHVITPHLCSIPRLVLTTHSLSIRPSIIKSLGFDTYTSNALTVPAYILSLVISVAHNYYSDRYGNRAYHCVAQIALAIIGYVCLQALPDNTNKWGLYVVVIITLAAYSWHALQVAWVTENMAPMGKRSLAMGAIIAAANIAGVPGSQIYRADDQPRFHRGNWINIALLTAASVLFLCLRAYYVRVNRKREEIWSAMTDSERQHYRDTTEDRGNNRLDFRFSI